MTDSPGTQLDRLLCPEGTLADRLHSFDWGRTPLGPLEEWPASLRSMAAMVLENRFPMTLWWGRDLLHVYNAAYAAVLGGKHPAAMGQPAARVWHEIWHIVGPQSELVLGGRGATWNEHLLLPMNRKGFLEETYFTYSYSPVRDDEGGIGGVLITCQETTVQVQGERQQTMLRDLGAQRTQPSAEQACADAAAILARNDADIPFALLYLLRGDGAAHLVASSGFAGHEGPAMPERMAVDDSDEGWPLLRAAAGPVVVDDLQRRFGPLPGGRWETPPARAVVAPLTGPGQARPYGFLVAGLSPLREFDDRYRELFRLTADQIVTGIASARAYEDERRRAEALAEIDRAKTAFFSNVSHEFRTPLTLLLGPAEEALAKPAQALAGDDLRTVHRNALRLLKLVNTLLDFARIEAGRIEANFEPTDLALLTAELASAFRSAVEKAGLTLTVDCPALGEDVYVDREMWEKIVLNLLSNAFKFTFDGGVTVRLRRDGGHCELSVRDTGTGIPAAELPRVFERFHRVQGTRGRTHEGSGIGLSLVQELVRLHGGTIEPESRPGEGTTFRVRIPCGRDHLPADRIGAPSTLASTAVGARPYVEEALRWLPDAAGGPDACGPDGTAARELSATPAGSDAARVLLADDNADMRDYLRRLLAGQWRVEAVADGAAALRRACEDPPDLVLTDVMMPGLDGFELLRALRQDRRTREIPVILLSARAGEEARTEGFAAGADDYVVKPFPARELVARIGGALTLARVRRESEQRLFAEAAALARLNELSSRLWRIRGLREGLEEMLAATIDLLGADRGNIQLLDGGVLRIAAQRGFEQEFLDHFREVSAEDQCACGHALRSGGPAVIADVETEAAAAPMRAVARAAGFRAVLSMPMFDRAGRKLGVISAHFRSPHRPSAPEIDRLTLYVRQAADFVERLRTEQDERESEARQAFLLTLTDALRNVADARAIMATAAELLGRHLDADRAGYAQTDAGGATFTVQRDWTRRGMPSLAGRHELQPFGPPLIAEFRAGRTIAFEDCRTCPLTTGEEAAAAWRGARTRAAITVPLVHDGGFTAVLYAHQREPRRWTGDEIALVEGVAARTWAAVERARAEEELRASQERFRSVSESGLLAIAFFDEAGAISDANDAFLELVGRRRAELEDRTVRWDQLTPPEWRPRVREVVAGYQRTGRIEPFEMEYLRKGGERFWGLFGARRIEATGEGVAFVLDVTQRKLAEEALREADRRKDEFLAMLGHELRNPLAAIRSATELMKLIAPDDGRLQRAHGVLERQSTHMTRLVDGLLEVSRIARGKIRLERETLDVRTVVEAVLEDRQADVQARRLVLDRELPAQPVWVFADPVRLAQVLDNLVGNAIKFTDTPGNIRVRLYRDGGRAVIRVRDTGVGIRPEMLERLFDPFQQESQELARSAGGLGLGLALSRGLAELHGGTIEVDSRGPGKGTEFAVRLPLAAAPGTEPGGRQGRGSAARRVLVIEDNADAGESMRDLLRALGHEVRLVADGAEALAALAERRADLVLCDIGLPGMSGYEVARAIRADDALRGPVLVAVSGYGQPEDRARVAAGFDAYLTKPVTLEALEGVLGKVCRPMG